MLLDQPRKSSTPKYCQNLVPRRSQLDMHRPRGSIVLRLSPMDLPIGDLLALMSADWTDTPTINYVRTDPTFVCQRAASAFLPRFTTELSVPLSCSPKCEGTWSRERFRMGSLRRTSLPPAIPPSRDVFRAPTPEPGPRKSIVWPSMQPEAEPEPGPYECGDQISARIGGAAEREELPH